MISFIRSAIESIGFGHHYGGHESNSRISIDSIDSNGKVWVPEHRHFVKGAAIVTLGAAASGLVYGAV